MPEQDKKSVNIKSRLRTPKNRADEYNNPYSSMDLDKVEQMGETAIFASKPKVIDDRKIVSYSNFANFSPGSQTSSSPQHSSHAQNSTSTSQIYYMMRNLNFDDPQTKQHDDGFSHFDSNVTKIKGTAEGMPPTHPAQSIHSRITTPATLHLGGSGQTTPAITQPQNMYKQETQTSYNTTCNCHHNIRSLDEKVDKLKSQVRVFRQYLRQVVALELEKYRKAAVIIQSVWRGYCVRKIMYSESIYEPEFGTMTKEKLYDECARYSKVAAGAYIGKVPDSVAAVGEGASGPLIVRQAATNIQRVTRGFLIRSAIERYNAEASAATQLQRLWRGYYTRKKLATRPSGILLNRKIDLQAARIRALEKQMSSLLSQLHVEKQQRLKLEDFIKEKFQ